MSKSKELWLSFAVGVSFMLFVHIVETSIAFPVLTEDMKEFCSQGNIHPDCP
jgi:hypothetical protein